MKSWNEKLVRITGDDWEIPGSQCRECGAMFHPERPYCPRCTSADQEAVTFARTGELVSCTQVRQASPESLVEAPYWLGLVRLDGGPVIELIGSASLNGSALRMGDRVQLTLEPITKDEDGTELVTYRFARAEESR